jgi:hypothetical protein
MLLTSVLISFRFWHNAGRDIGQAVQTCNRSFFSIVFTGWVKLTGYFILGEKLLRFCGYFLLVFLILRSDYCIPVNHLNAVINSFTPY